MWWQKSFVQFNCLQPAPSPQKNAVLNPGLMHFRSLRGPLRILSVFFRTSRVTLLSKFQLSQDFCFVWSFRFIGIGWRTWRSFPDFAGNWVSEYSTHFRTSHVLPPCSHLLLLVYIFMIMFIVVSSRSYTFISNFSFEIDILWLWTKKKTQIDTLTWTEAVVCNIDVFYFPYPNLE